MLYEEIINSNLKNILVSKEEQENLIDFLKKRKQIGENYLEIDLLHLLDDKQTFDEQGIENNIRSCLDLQEKILPVAWDKKKIRKKWWSKFLKWTLPWLVVLIVVFIAVLIVNFLFAPDPYHFKFHVIDPITKKYFIIYLLINLIIILIIILLFSMIITHLNVKLNPKKKLKDRLKLPLLPFKKAESIELTVGFKNFGAKTNWALSKFGKKQTFIQYLIKELLSGKTSVIVLDLDDYPPSYLLSLLILFKNIAANYNKENSKKLTFFYLTSKDLNEYNGFDFYIYPISKTNELVLKRTLKSDYEMVNTLFSNFKNKFYLPIYEDTYSFLIDYKKFYKTYINHFSLKEFFVILILKKYFYKYLWFLITNEEESNNTIDLSTFKTIINLEKVDCTKPWVSDLYNNIWKWAYSNSFFQIESANSIDFYSIFLTFFVFKLFNFTDLNDKCSCLDKYCQFELLKEEVNNNLAPCIKNKITDKGLELFIQENIGEDEKYNNFPNKVKKYSDCLNNLLDSKDGYYKKIVEFIEKFVPNIPELKNIYTNTLIKYHTNNNDHYIFILASFLNQIFNSKKIKTELVKSIISKMLWLAKPNYYLKLKNIFFLLDQKLQVYIIEIIIKEKWDELFVNDWITVFSKNELKVFGILLRHYRYKKYRLKRWKNSLKEKRFGRIEYYSLSWIKIQSLLDKKAKQFALDEWFRYDCEKKTTK